MNKLSRKQRAALYATLILLVLIALVVLAIAGFVFYPRIAGGIVAGLGLLIVWGMFYDMFSTELRVRRDNISVTLPRRGDKP